MSTSDPPPQPPLILDYQPLTPSKLPFGRLLIIVVALAIALQAVTSSSFLWLNIGYFQLFALHIERADFRFISVPFSWIFSLLLIPILAYHSDRARTRWGRRIPFLAGALPFFILPLPALGYFEPIDRWVRSLSHIPATPTSAPASAGAILAIGALITLFEYATSTVGQILYWLVGDVIPHHLLGRVTSLFGVLCTLPMLGAMFFLFRPFTHTPPWLFPAATVLILAAFLPLFVLVRERPFPPPRDVLQDAPLPRRFTHALATFFTQSFTHPIYLSFYAYHALFVLASACSVSTFVLCKDVLHLTLPEITTITFASLIVGLVVAIPLGWLADVIHPLRALILSLLLVIPLNVAGFFINGWLSAILFLCTNSLIISLTTAAAMPATFRLFPSAQYAQFASVNAAFGFLFGTTGVWLAAFLNSTLKDTLHLGPNARPFGFLFQAVFQVLALACLLTTHRLWREHGGRNFSYQVDLPRPAKLPLGNGP